MSSASEGPRLDEHLLLAFATPVVSYPWPDSEALNDELRTVILDAERRDTGVQVSNVGGWHSAMDLLEWDAEPVRALLERIRLMTIAITRTVATVESSPRSFDFRAEAWANIARDGHYNSVHNHPTCLWSGTYYVSGGAREPETPLNGRLELLDPRTGANMVPFDAALVQSRFLITPVPGLMVVFPGWLNHLVHPFHGTGERISIAFNIMPA